jgi:hypothetical protein
MIVIVVFAILLAVTRSGLVATMMYSVIAFYYGIACCVLSGLSRPLRRPLSKAGLSEGRSRRTTHFERLKARVSAKRPIKASEFGRSCDWADEEWG